MFSQSQSLYSLDQGMWEASPVDGTPVVVYAFHKRLLRQILSHGVFITLVLRLSSPSLLP